MAIFKFSHKFITALAIAFSVCICGLFLGIMLPHPQKSESTAPRIDYFAVCLGTFDDLPSARAFAVGVQNRGGAGFIYSSNKHRVLASLYSNRSDCETIVKRLNTAQVSAELFMLTLSEIKLHSPESVQQLNILLSTASALYTLANELDSGNCSVDIALAQVKTLADKLTPKGSALDIVSVRLRAEFIAQNSYLSALALLQTDPLTLSTKLRYAELKLVCDLILLRKEIAV